MFVVCPSCAGPFRIPADQIAPLVQIACPHCTFRMILDFEAANEPSLVEPGQLMAQGFETAEQYFSVYSHVGPTSDLKPRFVEAPAAEAPRPVVEAPRPQETVAPPRSTPPTTPAATPAASKPAPIAASEPVATPAAAAASATPTSPPRQVGNKTIIQTPKKPASMDPGKVEPAIRQSSDGPSMRIGRGVDVPMDEPAAPVAEAKVSAIEPTTPESGAERRAPPHTPPAEPAVSNAPTKPEPVQPSPEDIAAQSGTHPGEPKTASTDAKPAEPTKDAPKQPDEKKPPVVPAETGSSGTIFIVVAILVLATIGVLIYLNTR